MENKLFKFEHDEYGIWYFTTLYKAAKALGTQPTHITYFMGRGQKFKGWSIEEVDGSDVIYQYINPERI